MRLPSWRLRATWLLASVTAFEPTALDAQLSDEATTPATLPRPGFDRPPKQVGSATLRLDFDLSALYDSNVYATHTNPQDDAVLHAGIRAAINDDRPHRAIHGEAYVDRNQHVDIGRETSTSFGALARGKVETAKGQAFGGTIRFDRAIESRSDPEARASLLLSPRKIDISAAEGEYSYHPSRLGFDLSGGAQRYNFLDPNEHDRDMLAYQGSLRLSWQLNGTTALFLNPYAARRDFVTRVDANGVNRDATTAGALLGISRGISGAISGRIGMGFFRFMPDSPMLRPFTGFAANGEISWRPRRRTELTATIFSGDVATVRAGATSRHDTNIALRIDQEARHNLLLDATIRWEQAKYRGAPNADRDTLRLQGGATYLVNSVIALFVEASFTRRTAAFDLNSFNRRTLSVGVRLHR